MDTIEQLIPFPESFSLCRLIMAVRRFDSRYSGNKYIGLAACIVLYLIVLYVVLLLASPANRVCPAETPVALIAKPGPPIGFPQASLGQICIRICRGPEDQSP